MEDTFCFLLPREIFLELIEKQPAFAHYYLKSFSEKIVTTAYNELRHHKVGRRSSDDLYLFSIRVGDLVKTLRKVSAAVTIQEAAALMTEHRVGCLLVHDAADADKIAGIITDRDLRSKVVAAGLDYNEPVAAIMNSPVQTVLSQSLCFDVLLKMMTTGFIIWQWSVVVGLSAWYSHDIALAGPFALLSFEGD